MLQRPIDRVDLTVGDVDVDAAARRALMADVLDDLRLGVRRLGHRCSGRRHAAGPAIRGKAGRASDYDRRAGLQNGSPIDRVMCHGALSLVDKAPNRARADELAPSSE